MRSITRETYSDNQIGGYLVQKLLRWTGLLLSSLWQIDPQGGWNFGGSWRVYPITNLNTDDI